MVELIGIYFDIFSFLTFPFNHFIWFHLGFFFIVLAHSRVEKLTDRTGREPQYLSVCYKRLKCNCILLSGSVL